MTIDMSTMLGIILILLILGFMMIGAAIGYIIGYRTHHWDIQRENKQQGYPKDWTIDEKDPTYSAEITPARCLLRYDHMDDLGCAHTRNWLYPVATHTHEYNPTEIPLYRDGLSPLAVRRG